MQTSSLQDSLSSGNFFPSNRSSNDITVNQESFADIQEDVIEPAHHSTAIFDHDTPVSSYNGQASDVNLIDLSNSAERTIGTTPEQSGLDHDNYLQLYFQSRTIRLPVPESCNSTETNNLTIDERLELYSNDSDNSNASPPPLLHRDNFPTTTQEFDSLNSLPPLQRAPSISNWRNNENSEAPCDVNSDSQINRPRITGIQIRKEANGTGKRHLLFSSEK